ncbi:MAG TPA: hypothetical protein VHJ39_11345 [Solirubrobacteraceae bacterium]|jgi:hypothetical protein|nr:hypothetical protein [Solirubrobacteraceae bacterium]
MGLLDDAIREHLELRRAHGADPTEVERQEREALGAPRQAAEFASPSGDEEAPAAVAAEAAAPEERETELEPEAEPEAQETDEAWFEDEPDEVPRGEALEHPPAAADEQESEDVLEETPEFLQETPEHDRLWFEQRPPRDFDWDK